MNKINILSPMIGFPILYLFVNLSAIDTMSNKVIIVMSIFYISYYLGIFISRTMTHVSRFNRLDFSVKCFADRCLKNELIFKFCAIAYCATIISQFFKFGINDMAFFRAVWIDNIPMGRYIMTPVFLGTQIFVFIITIKYIQGRVRKKTYLVVNVLFYGSISILGSRSVFLVFVFIQYSLFYLFKRITTKQTIYVVICLLVILMLIRLTTIYFSGMYTISYYESTGLIDFGSPFKTLILFFLHSISDIAYRTQFIIDNIPDNFDYTYGKSLFFPFYSMLPGKQVNPTVLLNHNLFYGSDDEVGYPPTIAAQIYMDFGWIGLAIIPMIIGCLYTNVFLRFRKQSNFFNLFVYILLTYYLILSCYGEFLIFYIFIFLIFYFLNKLFFRRAV